MTNEELASQLVRIAESDGFEDHAAALAERWRAAGVGAEAVGPVLRFMEEHPELEYGTPGPLVHFVEQFRGRYEDALIESVSRRPTEHTVWMLNRVVNGAQADARRRYVEAMRLARLHPRSDEATLHLVDRCLERLSERPA